MRVEVAHPTLQCAQLPKSCSTSSENHEPIEAARLSQLSCQPLRQWLDGISYSLLRSPHSIEGARQCSRNHLERTSAFDFHAYGLSLVPSCRQKHSMLRRVYVERVH